MSPGTTPRLLAHFSFVETTTSRQDAERFLPFVALVYATPPTPRLPRLQAHSSGGRVHAFLDRAINLPDADRHQQSGLSDPYVKFSVGSTVVSSAVVDESLNPVRNRERGFEVEISIAAEATASTPGLNS